MQEAIMQAENNIPEFEANKEYPIVGFFKIGKEVFKVVNSACCSVCDIAHKDEWCAQQICAKHERDDKTSVGFILYDELED